MSTITTLDQPIRELGVAQTAIHTAGSEGMLAIAQKARDLKVALTAKTEESTQRQATIDQLQGRITDQLEPRIRELTQTSERTQAALEEVTETKDRAELQVRDLTGQNRALTEALQKALREIAQLKAAAEANQRDLGQRTADILRELNQ
jgi:chromosome segregation ATPase